MKQFPQKVTLARKTSRYPLEKDLAKVLGVTQGSVSQWEKGLTYPDLRRVIRLAEVTERPLAWFLIDDELPKAEPTAVRVSVEEFVKTVLYKEHVNGTPAIWAQWPNEEIK